MTKRNEVLSSLFPDIDTTRVEGEFIPDQDEPESPPEYKGELRFVNIPPTRLRDMLRENLTASDRTAVETALSAWGHMQKGIRGGIEAGEPYRGETRTAQTFGSIREMAEQVKPVEHIFVMSFSGKDGCVGIISGEPNWLGIFDFDELEAGLRELPG